MAYLGMVAAWMLDFNAESGAAVATQAIFLALYLFFLSLFVIGDRGGELVIPGLPVLIAAGALFMLVGAASGILSGQKFYSVFRNFLTVFIYISSTYATARIVAQAPPAALRTWLGALCLAYLVSGFVIGLLAGHRDIDQVRFEIQGSSLVVALGLIPVAMVFGLRQFEWASLGLSLVVAFLSITRTNLGIIAAQVAPFLRHPRVFLAPRFVVVVALLALAGGLMAAYGGFGIDRWIDRMNARDSNGGVDPTYLTRVSEWDFMVRHWTDSSIHMLFGNGLAAQTTYFVPNTRLNYSEGSLGFGHNQYLSILFTAGLVGGAPLLLVQAWQVLRAVALLGRVAAARRAGWHTMMLAVWGAVSLVGYAVANSFASIYIGRGPSMWFGIATGLLLGGQACFMPENRSALIRLQRRAHADRQARE